MKRREADPAFPGWIGLGLLVAAGVLFSGLAAAADGSPPTISSFSVRTVTEGGKGAEGIWVEFSWVTEGADSVRLYKDGQEMRGRHQLADGGIGWPLSMEGGLKVRLTKPAVYELVAENADGQVSRQVEGRPESPVVREVPTSDEPRILSFEATPRTINRGESVRFSWKTQNASQVHLLDDRGPLESRIELPNGELGWPFSMDGALQESPEKTTTYTLVVMTKTGRTSQSLEVTVMAAGEAANGGPEESEEDCRVVVSIHGKYGKATDAVGVFRAQGSGLGDFLFKRPVTTVRDHREGRPGPYQRSIITLSPGEYVLVPSGGGDDKYGSFGVIYKPGRSRFSCEDGNSERISVRADSAEY